MVQLGADGFQLLRPRRHLNFARGYDLVHETAHARHQVSI
jgi:hypothetical protein